MRTRTLIVAACASCASYAAASGFDHVTQAAAMALLSSMGKQGLTGSVRPKALLRGLDSVAASMRVEARPPTQEQVRPRMVVWVDVYAAERFVRSVPVALDVELSQDGGTAPSERRQPEPRQPTLALQAEGPSEVLRGEWAALRTAAGAVSLESRVEVLQDGRAGDRVRVRQAGATGIVLARVVGRGQLELAP
ncbi:MAG: flagella basal body P-ring formation protein FlgA [Ramlibacter sp.]|jgi:flagella basal body P-ring formation protein FlgA|nr:flagella basal body P-ring formation protein FlgA [Ramlibacter sp.]